MGRKKRTLAPQAIFDEESLLSFLASNDIKQIHARKIWMGLLRQVMPLESPPPSSVALSECLQQIPGLPQAAYDRLPQAFAVLTSKVVEEKTSSDGSTTKLLVELQDGNKVESVIMRHQNRRTLCVSSQIGCQMGCTFCATGTLGIIGNLNAGEILEQLIHANRVEAKIAKEPGQKENKRIRNVVFMGQGEPLNNYDSVLAAIRAMVDTSRFGLSPRTVTLSTVGIVPKIFQLTKDAPFVQLAVSLHAPTQELRKEIVPASKAFSLDKLMDAIRDHLSLSKERVVMIEYVMLKGVNDSEELATTLGNLLKGLNVLVNLIPYNPTDVGFDYESPTKETIKRFQAIVQSYKIHVTVRETMGQDIDGACGQLAIKSAERSKNSGDGSAGDIEDLMGKKSTGQKKPSSSTSVTRGRGRTSRKTHKSEQFEQEGEKMIEQESSGSMISGRYWQAGLIAASVVLPLTALLVLRGRGSYMKATL